jgi:hypothetical protein
MGHPSENTGAMDFSFHFAAEEIHQNLYSLFGRENLCDYGFQTDKGALDNLHPITCREIIV